MTPGESVSECISASIEEMPDATSTRLSHLSRPRSLSKDQLSTEDSPGSLERVGQSSSQMRQDRECLKAAEERRALRHRPQAFTAVFALSRQKLALWSLRELCRLPLI